MKTLEWILLTVLSMVMFIIIVDRTSTALFENESVVLNTLCEVHLLKREDCNVE